MSHDRCQVTVTSLGAAREEWLRLGVKEADKSRDPEAQWRGHAHSQKEAPAYAGPTV